MQLEYCNVVTNKLKMYGIRAEVCHGERLPKLIRNAEKQKIPLMAVVGSKEVETETVTVRSRFGGELGTMPVDDFINRIKLGTVNPISLWWYFNWQKMVILFVYVMIGKNEGNKHLKHHTLYIRQVLNSPRRWRTKALAFAPGKHTIWLDNLYLYQWLWNIANVTSELNCS